MTMPGVSSARRFGMWHPAQSVELVCFGRMRSAASTLAAVALPADGGVVRHGFGAARDAVRIVAGVAGQPAFALQEALGFPQPVDRADGFEFVVVTGPGRMVEGEHEGVQRLAGPERKRAAVEAHQRCRECVRWRSPGGIACRFPCGASGSGAPD